MPCCTRFGHGTIARWTPRYPFVIFDALRLKIRDADSRMVKTKAVHITPGAPRKGLGPWIADN